MKYLIWAVGACLLNHRRERILREKYIVIFDFVDRIQIKCYTLIFQLEIAK